MSSIVNKVKDALHSDKDKKHDETHGAHAAGTHATTGTHGTHGTTHGTTGNTLGGDHTAVSTGVPHANPSTGGVGTEALGYAPGPAPHTAGAHKSDALNKADPRIDSDLDGSRNFGATSAHQTAGGNNAGLHSGAGTTGLHSGTGVHSGTGHSGLGGAGTTAGIGSHGVGHSGVTGYDDPQGIHGPHSSRVANTADPRVDSDRDHRGAPGTHGVGTHTGTHGIAGHSGPGPAPNTAGPHKSDVLNKADPRVDSNLDGSKTVGGDKTYQAGNTDTIARDPTDAAQVPPSVLRKHVGDPTIHHNDHTHDRDRRNSTTTHQDQFSGI